MVLSETEMRNFLRENGVYGKYLDWGLKLKEQGRVGVELYSYFESAESLLNALRIHRVWNFIHSTGECDQLLSLFLRNVLVYHTQSSAMRISVGELLDPTEKQQEGLELRTILVLPDFYDRGTLDSGAWNRNELFKIQNSILRFLQREHTVVFTASTNFLRECADYGWMFREELKNNYSAKEVLCGE